MAAGVGAVRAMVGMKTAAGKKIPTASSLGRRRALPLAAGWEWMKSIQAARSSGEEGVEMERAGIETVKQGGEGYGAEQDDDGDEGGAIAMMEAVAGFEVGGGKASIERVSI